MVEGVMHFSQKTRITMDFPLEQWYFDIPPVTRTFITLSALVTLGVVRFRLYPSFHSMGVVATAHDQLVPAVLQPRFGISTWRMVEIDHNVCIFWTIIFGLVFPHVFHVGIVFFSS